MIVRLFRAVNHNYPFIFSVLKVKRILLNKQDSPIHRACICLPLYICDLCDQDRPSPPRKQTKSVTHFRRRV